MNEIEALENAIRFIKLSTSGDRPSYLQNTIYALEDLKEELTTEIEIGSKPVFKQYADCKCPCEI